MKRIGTLLLFFFHFLFAFAQGSKNLDLLSTLNVGQTLAGCWHYDGLNGKEYALLGAANGIIIVDITVPTTPIIVTQLPGVSSLWHEIKVQGDYAYAVSEGLDATGTLNGMQIIDLRFLPDSVPNKFYRGDLSFPVPLDKAHSITTSGNYVFVNGHNITAWNRGVIILDISDPWNPVYVSNIAHAYCHDSYVRGNLIIASELAQFAIFDISNPALPNLLATQTTPANFNHNTWLSDDGNFLFATDERPSAPLSCFDVSNLGNIALVDTFLNGNFSSSEVHNVRVFNDFLICPSYGSQLTLVDGYHPDNMIEVGNYTTGSSLCWDADPYTNSGSIIATDMNSGTFYLFAPTYRRACYLEGNVVDSLTGANLFNVDVTFQSLSVSCKSDLLGNFKTGYADSGTYVVTFMKSGYYDKSVTVILSNGILTPLSVALAPIGASVPTVNFENINIYPNPSNESVNIKSTLNGFEYTIYNSIHQKVLGGQTSSSEISINTKNFPAGTYVVEILNSINTFKRKISIIH